MKPICAKCQRFYRPKKTGTFFVEAMSVGDDRTIVPGTSHPEQWKPYKLWCGDLWHCLGCGHELVVGVGLNPLAEHYQDDFVRLVERTGAELQVNDC